MINIQIENLKNSIIEIDIILKKQISEGKKLLLIYQDSISPNIDKAHFEYSDNIKKTFYLQKTKKNLIKALKHLSKI